MTKRLIAADRSIMIAADVPTIAAAKLLASVGLTNTGVSSYKVGFQLGLKGLEGVVQSIRHSAGHTVVIYDHQKAGNDIPDMGAKLASQLKIFGVDAVILFPFTGPDVQREWTKACKGEGLHVLVGGMMTHDRFLVSEGGYIDNDTPERIYKSAIEQEVTDFVMPGTKLEWVQKICQWLEHGLGHGNYDAYAPGFISQGGDITKCGKAAGPRFHAIVGSAIYGKNQLASLEQMRAAAFQCTSSLGL
ncbi:MAG: hypothetical protein V4474_00785 [Patescibacteria group bacterium]